MSTLPDDPYDPVNLLLKERKQIEAEFAQKLARIDNAISQLRGSSATASVEQTLSTGTQQPNSVHTHQTKTPLPKDSVYYGLGLPDAATKALSLSENQTPLKPREIALVLEAAGYATAKSDLAAAVRSGLMKRQVDHRDVLPVGGGRWGMRDWYSEEQIVKIIASLGEKPTRDASLHSEQTSLGMMIAKARGARIGRATVNELYVQTGIVAEYRRRRQGGMSVEEARLSFDRPIPRSTITVHKNLFEEGLPSSARAKRGGRKAAKVVSLRLAK